MPRGAKKQFDRTQALERAMELFWERGYAGVGLAALLERMGIGRQSLYDTFGSKKELFLEALDHYAASQLGPIREQLAAPGSPLANARRAMQLYEQFCTADEGRGCLLVNSLAEADPLDGDVQAFLRQRVAALEAGFTDAFQRAKDAGELRAEAEPSALASAALSLACGITLMSRLGSPGSRIRDAIRMNALLLESLATPGARAGR